MWGGLIAAFCTATIGALAVTDIAIFRDAYAPLLIRSHIVTSPDQRFGNEAMALDEMRELLAERHNQTAAVIAELLVLCRRHFDERAVESESIARAVHGFGVHLIADEIAVGCGRSGALLSR
ncbi:hypothetical protein DFLDMN_000207 [Cupriavidus sp. H19C3]